MTAGARYALAAVGIGAAVGTAGSLLVSPAVRPDVWVGVVLGLIVQIAAFWLLVVRLFPARRLLAFALGMAGRGVTVLAAAVALALGAGPSPAPVLFALAAVLFLTTLIEPVVANPGPAPER